MTMSPHITDSPCPSSWIDQDAACYFFQPGNSENTSLTWYEARDRCRDLALPANGFLVALSSRTEQVRVPLTETRFQTTFSERYSHLHLSQVTGGNE